MTAEILTGIAPFTADTEAQLMKKIMEEEPEIDWSKIPEPFTEIVRRCLEKERAKRWTAEQVLTALAPSPERSRRATPELTAPSPELTAPSPELTVPSPERSRRATPELKPAPPETTPMISAVGMDYTNLRDFLAAKKWREADEETLRVMLKVAGREKEGWLDTESIDKFPCEDLRTIDQLWVKYSNGRFGFSVQKRIYQSLGGTREYDTKVWEAFGDKVGWRKKNEWLYYNDLTFSEKAPEAHLPLGPFIWVAARGFTWFKSLLSRRDLFTVPSPELTVPSPDRSRKATPEPKLAPPETTPMVSAVGMDYINLRNLLAAKKWKEADEETRRVMFKVAGREEERWLNSESIDNFPCEDLRTIDQLWVKYSNGRFGFSVQKRIYQSLGGTREYKVEVWEKFGDKVGWSKNNSQLYYKDLTFSEKAPEAHLPVCGATCGGGWFSLLSRRDLFTVPSPELTVPSPERSRRATPELKPTPPETTPMVSAVGMDYIKLRDLLAAKKWKEADIETRRVMLKVAGRTWLDTKSIEKFPCEDLRTIDQLWVKYSNGRFGFSVQKRIYQSLGGTSKYDEEIWNKFGNKVGWGSKDDEELYYYEDLTLAKEAHLPMAVWGRWVARMGGRRDHQWILNNKGTSSLASRLVDCNI